MILRRFFDRRRREAIARRLYTEVVAQSRLPGFYAVWGVPDSVDGRFDLLVAHAFLVMRRLGSADGAAGPEARAVSQALFDLMFADLDQNLREMGVSDLAVGSRIKTMAEAFYGRVAAYDGAIAADEAALAAALNRNVFRDSPALPGAPSALAAYLRRQAAELAAQPIEALLAGEIVLSVPEFSP